MFTLKLVVEIMVMFFLCTRQNWMKPRNYQTPYVVMFCNDECAVQESGIHMNVS